MATNALSLEPLQSKTASLPGNVTFSPVPNVSPPPSLIGVEGIPKDLFVKPVDDQFICTICQKVLRWAMQEGCGCRACYGCLQRSIKSQSESITCPNCGESFPREEIIKDNHARKKLERLKVYCANKEAGCKKQLPLKNLDEHVQQDCQYEMIQCIHSSKGCTTGVLRHKFAQHLEKECMFRRVKCQFCGLELMANELELHEKKCRELMVSCPNNCGTALVHKDKIDEHISTSCPLSTVDCLFKHYGCNRSEQRKMMDVHMQEAQVNHLQLVLQCIVQMGSTLSDISSKMETVTVGNQMQSMDISGGGVKQLAQKNEKQMRELQRNIAPRLEKIDKLEDSMNQMAKQTTVIALQESLKPVQDNYHKIQSKLKELEQQIRQGSSSSSGETLLTTGNSASVLSAPRITAMENQMGMHAVRIAEHDLRFQVMETASFDGTLLWKIKDFSRRKRDADNGKTLSLYSQPFYTSRYGYKMCARVYLNGDGMGKGTHVSLFFVVMRGDYDALLPWPFCHKVTLILMDQETGRRHLTDSFRPDPASSSFQRPSNEMNIASGCPLFVSQSVLSEVAYVKDNVMFIKVIVDVTDVVRP